MTESQYPSTRPNESLDPSLFDNSAQPSMSDPLPIDPMKESDMAEVKELTPGPRDILFGKIAVQERFINERQLQECVDAQKTLTPKQSLGRIMQDRGYISPLQIEVILDIQRVNMADRQEHPQTGGLFGTLAVSAGFCTRSHVEDAVRRQKETQMPMGRILFENGHLNSDQVLEILRRQEKGSIRCDGCGSNYLIEGLAMGTKFACRRCFRVISITEAVVAPPPVIQPASAPRIAEKVTSSTVVRPPAEEGSDWTRVVLRCAALLAAIVCGFQLSMTSTRVALAIVVVASVLFDVFNSRKIEAARRAKESAVRGQVEAFEAKWQKLIWTWNHYGAWEKIGRRDPKELTETNEAVQRLKQMLGDSEGSSPKPPSRS